MHANVFPSAEHIDQVNTVRKSTEQSNFKSKICFCNGIWWGLGSCESSCY